MNEVNNIIASSGSRPEKLTLIQAEIDKHISTVRWVVDALIPEDRSLSMPSATGARVPDIYLAEIFALRDDMAAEVLDTLSQLPSACPPNPLEFLYGIEANKFDNLSRLVAGAYFVNPEISFALKYTAQQAIRENPDYDFIVEKIEPLIDRGEIFTQV